MIRSGIIVDGIKRYERNILIDQNAHVELSFPLDIPDDGRPYNTYGVVVYTPPTGAPVLLFRTSNLMNPFVVFIDGDLPVYTVSEPGMQIVVDFYKGLLNGLPGKLEFYVGYSPEGGSVGTELLFNSEPYVIEIK